MALISNGSGRARTTVLAPTATQRRRQDAIRRKRVLPQPAQVNIAQLQANAEARRASQIEAARRFAHSRLEKDFRRLAESGATPDQLREARLAIDAAHADSARVVQNERAIGRVASDAMSARRSAERKRKGPGGLGGLVRRGVLGGLEIANKPIEELVNQPLAAQRYHNLHRGEGKGSLWSTIASNARVFTGALPGLGFVAGKGDHRESVEATNSWEERQLLHEEGKLPSFGEMVSGRSKQTLSDPGLRRLNPRAAEGSSSGALSRLLPEQSSGLFDAGIQVFADPTNILQGVALELAHIGRVTPAKRLVVLQKPVGEALLDAATDAAVRAPNSQAMRRAIPNLPTLVADEVEAAASAGGADAVRQVLADAFVAGEWDPIVKLRNQAQLRVGLRSTPGRSAVRTGGSPLDAMRGLARGDTPQAIVTDATNVTRILQSTIDAGLNRLGQTLPDFRAAHVDPLVSGMTPILRMQRLAAIAATTDNAAFADIVRSLKGDFIRNRSSADVMKALERAETAAALLDVRGKAAEQARVGLSRGLAASPRSGIDVMRTAQRNIGKARTNPTRNANTPAAGMGLFSRMSPALARKVQADLAAAANNPKQYAKVVGYIDATLRSPRLLAEAERLVRNEADRLVQGVAKDTRPGLLRRAAGATVLSFAESAPPNKLPFERTANQGVNEAIRVDGMRRWGQALGLDEFTSEQVAATVEKVRSEEQLFGALHNAMAVVANRYGVNAKALQDILKEAYENHRRRMEMTGHTVAQRIEEIPLPDPADIRRTVMDLKAAQGDIAARIASTARGLSATFAANALNRGAAGAVVGAASGAALGDEDEMLKGAALGAAAGAAGLGNIHKLWKFTIVTGIPALAVGGVTAAATGNPMLLGIGALTPVRYIARVALIEEGLLRRYLRQGFTSVEFIPGVSKWARRRGLSGDLLFRPTDAVKAGNTFGTHLSNRLLTTVDNDWEMVPLKGTRGIDAWWRIVNRQIRVETDPLAETFVRARAGYISDADAADSALRYLKQTDQGKLLLSRLRGAVDGPKTAEEAVARYKSFVDEHMSPTIADARLRGEVVRDILKVEKKLGRGPAVIHAQKTWVLPKSWSQFLQTADQMLQKTVLGGPTNKLNRVPMAEHIYAKEVRRLINNGVSPQRAQDIAEEIAVEQTNRIMFQIEDESRAAKKLDFVFPFQQPREEVLRVWGRMVLNNPVKAIKVLRLGALAFNNGQETGMFRQDPFGEWVMTVPGSTYLSDRLFGSAFGFEANLRDFLFVGQGAFGLGFIPSPGGPYWTVGSRMFLERNPEAWSWLESHPWMRQLLMPYAPSGKLLRPEANRLWMAATGGTPPWEFASTQMQENEMRKWQREIALHLRHEHLQKHPTETDWWPSQEEVAAGFSAFMKSWAFFGSVFPAAPRPINLSRNEADAIRDAYTKRYGAEDWYRRAVEENPGIEPYFSSQYEYVGPDDFKHWSERDELNADKFVNSLFDQRTWQDMKRQVEEGRKKSEAFNEMWRYMATPDRLEREALLIEWRKKYPEYADDYRNEYMRDKELATILQTYPRQQRDAALDRWRRDFDVSPSEFNRLKWQVLREFKIDPWREARNTEDVMASVRSSMRLGTSEVLAVQNLQPAEQIRYWQGKLMEFTYDRNDEQPQAVLDRYYLYKNRISDLWRDHPELRTGDGDGKRTVIEEAVARWQGDAAKAISDTYAEIERVREAMDRYAKAKQWKWYYALRDKRTALYDQIKVIRNEQFKGYPGLEEAQDEIRAMWAYAPPGMRPEQWDAMNRQMGETAQFMFVAGREEMNYLAMPDPARLAYVDDLVEALAKPNGEKGKLFWEWLTDFQRELLGRNLPADMVADITNARPEDRGASGSGFRRGGRRSTGNGELDFAYAMFEQYNQRGGRTAPAAYKEYLALPNNPVVRADFLKRHPEVGEWIRLGPMANMPEVIRYLVANTMIKHGKWEGELRTIEEITDLAFAREQMARWTRRPEGARAPETYDLWVNMPTGVAKAQYFKAHPEIADWLKLGPMANMPDDYKEVVRDIMVRYGEWTERQDPLGKTISEFYATPGYARDGYLKAHPELLEYWTALRTPEENRMFALSDQYFSLTDNASKKSFLASHPDLQQWFVDQRTKRYERFLNRVAQFMGANPEMFTQYLERQEDILVELLRNFSEPNLLREIGPLRDGDTAGTSEGGRRRAA